MLKAHAFGQRVSTSEDAEGLRGQGLALNGNEQPVATVRPVSLVHDLRLPRVLVEVHEEVVVHELELLAGILQSVHTVTSGNTRSFWLC